MPAALPRALEQACAARHRPGIAVLPFTNMSGDRAQDYFSDGISDDIITALSKLRWFFVIARNSSFVYKGRSVHINEIARDLGVRYLVEGSVRRSGDQVRISAQLNDVTTVVICGPSATIAASRTSFAVQDEITEAIVAAVEPHLYGRRKLSRPAQTPGQPRCLGSGDARAVAFSGGDAAIIRWRSALLEKAIDIDPHYARRWGLLANSRIFGAHMGWAPMGSVIGRRRARRSPATEPKRGSWSQTHALGYSYLFARPSTMRSPSSSWRCGSIQFRVLAAFYAVTLCYRAAIAKATSRSAARCCSARAIRWLRPYYGLGAYIQSPPAIMTRRSGWPRESLRQRADFVGAHRVLTAAAGMARDRELSAIALQGCGRRSRTSPLEWIARELPMKLAEDREHYLDCLRRAGLKYSSPTLQEPASTPTVSPRRRPGPITTVVSDAAGWSNSASLNNASCGYGPGLRRDDIGCHATPRYSETIRPLPPNSAGKSFSLAGRRASAARSRHS